MASTDSRQRSHLLREVNRMRNSSASSRHSQSPQNTISDFDPENEAFMSTRQFEFEEPKLPELRASAQKYKHPRFPQPELDYVIDTSALHKAFPDFTQGSLSSNNLSIEVGRGTGKGSNGAVGKLGRSGEHSSIDIDVNEDSFDLKAPMIGNYEVVYTPPLNRSKRENVNVGRPDARSPTQRRRSSGLRVEVEPSPPSKTNDYGSNESRKSSNGSHRTLAAMHARVRDEMDVSQLSDERPPTEELTAKNTRFGNAHSLKPAVGNGLQTISNTSNGLQPTTSDNITATSYKPASPLGTQQSFVLPNMPNLTELVSGVFEDGTPVFSRDRKARASHFPTGRSYGADHGSAVYNRPSQMDEQAILLSLKNLEEKNALLERGIAETEYAFEELKQEHQKLQAEKIPRRKVSHRSDSALGTTDSDDGNDVIEGGQRRATIERNRLHSSVRSLQMQLDGSSRRAATTEVILQRITKERDSAVSQLSVAYVTIEQLKAEHGLLMQENADLKEKVGQLGCELAGETEQHEAKELDFRLELERRDDKTRRLAARKPAPNQRLLPMDGAAKSSAESKDPRVTSTARRPPVTQAQDQLQQSAKIIEGQMKTHQLSDDDSLFDLSPRPYEPLRVLAKSAPARKIQQEALVSGFASSKAPVRTTTDNGIASASVSRREMDTQISDVSKDLTLLSYSDTEEIDKLRQQLEKERIRRDQLTSAREQRLASELKAAQEQKAENPKQSTNAVDPGTLTENVTSRSDCITRESEPKEASMLSSRSRRRKIDAENMTSAFILPDITIRAPTEKTQALLEVTRTDHKVPETYVKHNSPNCTICKLSVRPGEHHHHDGRTRKNFTIPKPVPVSTRMPEPIADEEDPTIRPSQSPGLALATVLKGLEDEVAHLKINLAKYQNLYNGHDPSLSRRQRKLVQQKMEALLRSIDVKADQIYGLYDVLEGQRIMGQELTEDEIELTLQSIGISNEPKCLDDGDNPDVSMTKQSGRHHWDFGSDASEEELPWEGIDSTVDTTKSGRTRKSRRTSAP